MKYADLLRDPRWQRKRLEVMERADFACEKCGDRNTRLNVHHKKYIAGRMPWAYPGDLLECLCEPCHGQRHSLPRVPTRRQEALEEIHDRAEAIRSGDIPTPLPREGESDGDYLARVAANRRAEVSRKASA